MARSRLSSSGVRRARATASLALSCLSGCSGDLINLGSSKPLVVDGDAGTGGGGGGTSSGGSAAREWTRDAEPVLAPPDGYAYANGTFTSQLEMFFTIQQRGDPKAVLNRALPAGGRWTDAVPLTFGGAVIEDAASPAISLEGDELWFGSMGTGANADATDIWRSTPSGDTWSMPEAFGDPLNSVADDVPRPLAVGKTIMPLSSKRDSEHYRIYLAKRAGPGAPWDSVSADQLASVNAADESVDGFLTEDGLTLYFASKREGRADADLYRASRSDLDSAFGEPTVLTGLQSTADERDPWLTEDGNTLYFSSNRTGLYATYRARRTNSR